MTILKHELEEVTRQQAATAMLVEVKQTDCGHAATSGSDPEQASASVTTELVRPYDNLSLEVNLNRREIGEAPREYLPGSDFRDASACAGQNDLAALELVSTLA